MIQGQVTFIIRPIPGQCCVLYLPFWHSSLFIVKRQSETWLFPPLLKLTTYGKLLVRGCVWLTSKLMLSLSSMAGKRQANRNSNIFYCFRQCCIISVYSFQVSLKWLLSEVLKGRGGWLFKLFIYIIVCLFLSQVCLRQNFKHRFKPTLCLNQHLHQTVLWHSC